MGSKALLFVGLLFAIVVIASQVSARDLAETEQIDETNGVEDWKYPDFAGCRHGCCIGHGYGCRCCASAAEAEAYAAAQAQGKPKN